MIKVNLIPVKRKKKPKAMPVFIIVGVLALVASTIASLYMMFYMSEKIRDLSDKKEYNEKRISDLKEKIKEVENFKALNKTFLDKKKVIEDLRKNQSLPVRLLDEVNRRLTDGVWFTNFSITGAQISVDGMGFTTSDIVGLVQGLKNSEVFSDVVLLESRAGSQDGVDVYNFKITLKIKG